MARFSLWPEPKTLINKAVTPSYVCIGTEKYNKEYNKAFRWLPCVF